MTFEKRRLRGGEIDSLVEEIRKFPNPLTSKKAWEELQQVYIVTFQTELVGVCGIKRLNGWIKLGPFVVFKKYHHQGYGRKIFETVIKDYANENIFIGSRSPAVARLANDFGFREETNVLNLPHTIQLYLIKNILEHVSLNFIIECLRKNSTQEGPYRFFVRERYTNDVNINANVREHQVP